MWSISINIRLRYACIQIYAFIKHHIIVPLVEDIVPVWIRIIVASAFSEYIFFFFQPHYLTKSTVNSASMHCSRIHKFHFSATFSLKMGPTILFTHLKNYFAAVFSVSVCSFSKNKLNPNGPLRFKFWI